MEKPIVIVSLIMVLVAVLPEATSAAAITHSTQKNTEADYVHFSITRKQQQLAKLETEFVKVKRRSPRRQYTAGIESHMNMLRYELLELQRSQQRR